jgi:hypothetical protein
MAAQNKSDKLTLKNDGEHAAMTECFGEVDDRQGQHHGGKVQTNQVRSG